MILEASLFMGALAFCCSILLALASKIFHVDEDPRLTTVKSALPGLNCGGCGYAGCEGAAKAILSGKAPVSVCVVGDVEVIQQLMVLTGRGKGVMNGPEPRFNASAPSGWPRSIYTAGPGTAARRPCYTAGTTPAKTDAWVRAPAKRSVRFMPLPWLRTGCPASTRKSAAVAVAVSRPAPKAPSGWKPCRTPCFT